MPRIQAIRYPAQPGHDLAYGLRLSSSSSAHSASTSKGKQRAGAGAGEERKDWAFEIGKISDDSLKGKLVGGYVGLADGWYYFRLTTAGETHTFLASLFLTDLITRQEAESVLSRAPHSSPSSSIANATPSPSYLTTTIHRLPSLATLGGAYWAGSSAMTELVASSTFLAWASGSALMGVALPVAAGGMAVGGALMLFSRSARAGAIPVEQGLMRREQQEGEEEEETGTEMVLWRQAKGRRSVDVERVEVLDEEELTRNPIFPPFPTSRSIEDMARGLRRIEHCAEER